MIEKFLAVEQRYNLYNKQLEGVHYWVYSRFTIWMMIQTKFQRLGEAHRNSAHYDKKIEKTCRYLFNTWKSRKNIKNPKVDVLIFNHQRRVKNGDNYECIYTEWLSKYFPNQVVCECPYNDSHLVPNKVSNLFYIDGVIVYSEIKMLLDKKVYKERYNKIRAVIYEEIFPVIQNINAAYKCDLLIDEVVECIVSYFYRVKNGRVFYETVLDKTNPKVIVEVVHYSWHKMLINELARERGIPTIELQHGSLVSEPACYCYGENICIPQLPMYLYTFSEYWKNLNRLPPASTKAIAVGYPYFEQQISKYKYCMDKRKKEKAILFISQGTIGKELSRLAVALFHKLGAAYRIIYKLHPGEYYEWRKQYPWLVDTGIQVVDSLEHNIYEYFAECEYQVAVASTAIYEGLAFELKTFIYNCGNGYAEVVKDLVEYGYAYFVENENEIIALLESPQWSAVSSSFFWKANAERNIVREINKLMSGEEI